MESPRRHGQEPIAIIGLSLKFPQQASTPAAFWNLLVNGISARTEVPADRYNAKAFYDGGSKGHIKPGNVSIAYCLYILFVA